MTIELARSTKKLESRSHKTDAQIHIPETEQKCGSDTEDSRNEGIFHQGYEEQSKGPEHLE